MLLCSEKKANKKVYGFKVCSRVLNLIVIGHYILHNKQSQSFLGVHGFLRLTIIISNLLSFSVFFSK